MVLLFLHTSWFCCCCLIAFYFYSFSSLTQKSKRHRSHRLFVSRYLTIKIGLLNSPPPPSNLMLALFQEHSNTHSQLIQLDLAPGFSKLIKEFTKKYGVDKPPSGCVASLLLPHENSSIRSWSNAFFCWKKAESSFSP